MRTLQANHLQLSAIADQKASILVGATMVVLGVVAPLQADELRVTLVLLVITAALAGGAAVLSLLPRFRSTAVRPNVLFFGVHSRLDSDQFHAELAGLVAEDGRVYAAIAEDVHQMGKVLVRKFRLINVAYGILLVGLISTAVAYVIEV